MREMWRDILGYEGYYQVSHWGRVRSLSRVTSDGKRLKGRIRKPGLNGRYEYVPLSKGGVAKNLQVHRLVAQAFLPNPYNKPEVNHIDGDPGNNHVSNLEWATPKEQGEHASKTGLLGRVTEITYKGRTLRLGQWAEELGVKRSTLSARFNGSGMTPDEALSSFVFKPGKSSAKLTDQEVWEIRRLLGEGRLLQQEIAAMFHVCPQTVTNIKQGRTFSDLT